MRVSRAISLLQQRGRQGQEAPNPTTSKQQTKHSFRDFFGLEDIADKHWTP
jgi:hypothetical protein